MNTVMIFAGSTSAPPEGIGGLPPEALAHLNALAAETAVRFRAPGGAAGECSELFVALAVRLMAELNSPDSPQPELGGRMVGIRSAAKGLTRQISRKPGGAQADGCGRAVAVILRYMAQNYASEITLEQAAALVYMNPSYVSRLIKRQTGRNFTQLLAELRMEKAAELLRTTPLRVYEIAEAVGITNAKYFSQVYKKHTGLCPSDCRDLEGPAE